MHYGVLASNGHLRWGLDSCGLHVDEYTLGHAIIIACMTSMASLTKIVEPTLSYLVVVLDPGRGKRESRT